jgi:hypothetical protein
MQAPAVVPKISTWGSLTHLLAWYCEVSMSEHPRGGGVSHQGSPALAFVAVCHGRLQLLQRVSDLWRAPPDTCLTVLLSACICLRAL